MKNMSKYSLKWRIAIALIIFLALGNDAFSQCDSVNTILNSKIRYLGSWQSNGRPDYLESEKDTVSEDIQNFIDEILPETVNITNSGYFNDDLKYNTEILDTTELYLTYVHEGADWKNTLGFYTYPLDFPPSTYEDIDSLVIIFPNVTSPGVIEKGEKVYLGTFPPNTGVGYFLISKGWSGDTICLKKQIIFTDKKLNTFTSEQYRQHTVLLNYELENKFLLGIEDQPRPSGDMDFNDAVFYVTGKIDTNGVAKIPMAIMSGDTVLCGDEDLATVRIDLKGTPPFNVVYNNGSEDIEISDISTTTYTFETSIRDTLTLVSVEDAYGFGIVKGRAIIQSSILDAGFVNDTIFTCEGESETLAKIYFDGFPPYKLTYTEDGTPIELNNITEDTLDLTVKVGSAYILTEVEDRFCSQVLSDELEIKEIEAPTADLQEIDTTICEGSQVDLLVELTGEAPFLLTYNINGVEETVNVDEESYFISVNESANVSLIQVISGNCSGLATGSAAVSLKDRPTVDLIKPAVDCDTEQEVDLTLNFTGTAPFDYTYAISGNMIDGTSDGTEIITIAINETFKLLSFSDQDCDGLVIDSLHTFKNYSTPEAIISNSESVICGDGQASIFITFNGVPPFEAVISNGSVKDTITTNQFEYEYLTDQEGTFEIISVKNGECDGISSGQAVVTIGEVPTVDLQYPDIDCENTETAEVILNFGGEPPFNFSYKISDELFEATANENTIQVEVPLNSVFELFGFSNDECSGEVDENKSTFYNYSKPQATITTTDASVCDPGDEVAIEISLDGLKPITFEISNGDVSETITTDKSVYTYITDEVGTYQITSVSNDFCQGVGSGSALVELNEKPTADFYALSDTFCEGGTGTLVLDFTGEGPWSFTVGNGSFEETHSTSESHFEFTVSEPGEYQIMSFSDANCSGNISNSVSLTTIPKPTATIEGGGEFCGEDQFATILFTLTGEPPFIFTYTDGEKTYEVSTEETSYSVNVTKSGTYKITELMDKNCDGSFSGEAVVTNLGDELDGAIDGPETSCQDEQISLSFTGGENIETIDWTTTGNGSIENNGTTDIEYVPSEGETGEIGFIVHVANACGEKEFSKTVIIIATPDVDFTVSPDELFTDSDIVFIAVDGELDDYSWDLGDGNMDTGNQIIHVYTQGGAYEVTLSVDVAGCKNEISKGIVVKSKNELYVPNVFNPNALNAENRVAKVYGTNISEDGFFFRIVNRWGNTMYQTDSFITANSEGWDGKEFNINEEQSLATFSYILRGKFNDGETFERTGTITILQ